MFLAAGEFGYACIDSFANTFIEISLNFPFPWSDASDSDEMPTSTTLASIGVSALAVILTFEALVDGSDVLDAWRFTCTLAVLCSRGIASSTGSSTMRLHFGFTARDALCIAFADAFSVGYLPFGVAFPFNGAGYPSLEVEVELSLELDRLLAAFCFPASAFAFARAFPAFFSFSSLSFWQAAISAFISLPLEGTGEGVLGVLGTVVLPYLSLRFKGCEGICRAKSCRNPSTQSVSN